MRSVWHLLFLAPLLALARRCSACGSVLPWHTIGCSRAGRAPFDLAHWLPNMPRGSEQT
jgi:hypothetical protein